MRVLHVAAAGVLHADAEHVGDGLVGAVLDEQARVAPGADDPEVVPDVDAVELGLLRGETVFVRLGGLLPAAAHANSSAAASVSTSTRAPRLIAWF